MAVRSACRQRPSGKTDTSVATMPYPAPTSNPQQRTVPTLLAATAIGLAGAAAPASASTCEARSSSTVPTAVELYTSEGCSSCPPADRWLSTLKGRNDVIALAFHVTYWDRLGWPDRFASREFTQRQYDQASREGRAQVYTPQVVAQGQDWRGWPKLPGARPDAAAPVVTLQREGDSVRASVAPAAGRGETSFSGYWAVVEDGHQTAVRAGENAGENLRHDHVVRLLKPLPAWSAAAGTSSALSVTRGDAAFPRRVLFVVTEGRTQRPVQAVALAC
jgi:hypothetical protein